jgi:hypothetical protein
MCHIRFSNLLNIFLAAMNFIVQVTFPHMGSVGIAAVVFDPIWPLMDFARLLAQFLPANQLN